MNEFSYAFPSSNVLVFSLLFLSCSGTSLSSQKPCCSRWVILRCLASYFFLLCFFLFQSCWMKCMLFSCNNLVFLLRIQFQFTALTVPPGMLVDVFNHESYTCEMVPSQAIAALNHWSLRLLVARRKITYAVSFVNLPCGWFLLWMKIFLLRFHNHFINVSLLVLNFYNVKYEIL